MYHGILVELQAASSNCFLTYIGLASSVPCLVHQNQQSPETSLNDRLFNGGDRPQIEGDVVEATPIRAIMTIVGIAELRLCRSNPLCTDELQRLPPRPPNYEAESPALVMLAGALAESPQTVLQTLADTVLDVCQAGSAGISLLTKDDDGERFHWPAIAGNWKPHIGGGTPRDFGPCGDVLDRNATLSCSAA